MNKTEFTKKLRKYKIVFLENGTRHDIYIHKPTGKKIAIPRHTEFSNAFLKEVLKEVFER
jgi:hypothetical protein